MNEPAAMRPGLEGRSSKQQRMSESSVVGGNNKLMCVLVAGATGYLGTNVVKALASKGHSVKSLCRPSSKYSHLQGISQVVLGDVSTQQQSDKEAASLREHLKDVDIVISCIGASLLGDPRTVDKSGNMCLFSHAAAAGVKHFIMVTIFNGQRLRDRLLVARCKEEAADHVEHEANSLGIRWTIVRPTGFFKDMEELFMRAATTGKFPLVSDGSARVNPISGEDLAERICDCITTPKDWNTGVDVGGPDVLSMKEIGNLAFRALDRPPKFERLPNWLLLCIGWLLRAGGLIVPLLKKYSEALEFIRYVSTADNVAERYGNNQLHAHFQQLATTVERCDRKDKDQ